MKVAFRVDASVVMGTGHVMRSLSLADEFARKGIESVFVMRQHDGHLSRIVKAKGYHAILLSKPENSGQLHNSENYKRWLGVGWEEDAQETLKALIAVRIDYLVVDHYSLDYQWHRVLRTQVKTILVIDDLADRVLDADILIDQNYYQNFSTRYDGLVPEYCQCLLGPKFALLRDEFVSRMQIKKNDKKGIKRIFVFMGGGDANNQTAKVIQALDQVSAIGFMADIVVGASNPHAQEIYSLCLNRDYANFYQDISNMAERMARCDIAIGAGGSSSLERCALGLPSIVLVVADNQQATSDCLHKIAALECLGRDENVSSFEIAQAISALNNGEKLKAMRDKAMAIMGGNEFQGAKGVVKAMLTAGL